MRVNRFRRSTQVSKSSPRCCARRIGLLAGTDLGTTGIIPGASLHDELALLVDAGYTPTEALRAATLSPAEFLGLSDSLGAIERGKIADGLRDRGAIPSNCYVIRLREIPREEEP